MTLLKLLLKIMAAPVIVLLTLFVWTCVALVYVSGLVLGLVSMVIALLGGGCSGDILSTKWSDSAADCVSYQSLRTAQAGLLDAGQGAGVEICNSGSGVRIK